MNRLHSWSKGATFIALIVFLLMGAVAAPSPAAAQGGDDACAALVASVTGVVRANCMDLGADEACFGDSAMAMFHDPAMAADFAAAGDVVSLANVAVLTTSAGDPDAGTWGVVMASANTAALQPVTFALFGDAEISGVSYEAGEAPECEVTNNSGDNLNMRLGPSSQRGISGLFAAGDSLEADARNSIGDWVRVNNRGVAGWVYVPLADVSCDVFTLPPVADDGVTPVAATPLSAITLRTGTPEVAPACAAAPDGLMVAVGEETEAEVVINGALLQFQPESAVFVTAEFDGPLTLRGLTGRVIIYGATGEPVYLDDGEVTTILQVGLSIDGPAAATEFAEDFVVAPVLAEVFLNNTSYANAVEAVTGGEAGGQAACQVTNSSGNSINMRLGPSASRGIAGLFPNGETLLANARDQFGDWVRVERQGIVGWVFADLVTLSCDIDALPEAE